jgi:hypothetical protein
MMQASLRHAVRITFTSLLTTAWVIAQERAEESSARNERLARLESAIEQQQLRLRELEDLVGNDSGSDVDRARTEALKAQIREVLSEREFRDGLMPTTVSAGFQEGKGFYIRSSDENFSMNLRGFMQFRWVHYETQSRNRYTQPRLERDDRTGFDVQRLRLFVSGNVWSPDLTYRMVIRADSSNTYDATLHQAFVNYKFSDAFQVRFGVFQAAGTRAEIDDSDGYQLIDLGLTDAVFSFDQVMGVQFAGRFPDTRLGYQVQVVNELGTFRDRVITSDPSELDGNPAVLARLAWHVLGDDPGVFDYQGDLRKDKTQPALGIEIFKYAFNDDQGDKGSISIPFARPDRGQGGGFGLTNTNGMQYHQFAWATAFKWLGFSAEGEYVLRIVDPRRAFRQPYTPWSLLSGDVSTTAQHGAYLQCGYFLPIPGWENKFEVAGRVGGISVLSDRQEGVWEYAAGVNYYPIENNYRVKLQADVQRIYEAPTRSSTVSLAEVNDSSLVFRVQLQVGF